mmetsp:Transcript_5759/g.13116  ORF Transcript_5759/g.13116 Transcript_5759/m.13116 type:complete len:507 (-) Transcript_5759:1537-3057(-)|eukprot:CAMPEP_0172297600 /NCGR_PEP_ID=MMETSP1058-20130122/558_1 /TAXON_ID=83371 /ORGANISM="Detonula confervacea, Strain CCMP 353" /LENGTH=506 /DNA_ID=CAMNT_0013006769 /DNA_START=83 /DNA_END=1603 /DNA_ORIENTATION=-
MPAELNGKHAPAVGAGGASAWMNGAKLIDTLLHPDSRVAQVLTPEESEGLENIRKLLVSTHIQQDTIPSDLTSGDNPVNLYLAEQFGGVRRKTDFKKAARSVLNGLKFIKTTKLQLAMKAESTRRIMSDHKWYLPPEWHALSTSRQNYLYGLLSYDSLVRWGYDSLELSVACGQAPLLFIGWAILCAPHAQAAMATNLGLEEPEEADNVYEFVDEFSMKPEVLCNFLRLVEADYLKENPYHNSIHASDVTQTTFALLQMGGDKFSSMPLELFGLILAAACHDMGHPGKTNSYEVNSYSDLAMIYNDSSVLENMHAARACRLLSNKSDNDLNVDILSGLQTSQKDAFRATFTKAILWTDMSQHFTKLAQLKSKISTHGTSNPAKFYINVDGRSISSVILFILHVADIANPAKPAPISVEWCDRCLDELFAQGDAEKEKSMPVSPMCDRKLTVKSDSQLGFIKFIVRPAFVLMSDLMPRVVDEILPVLEENLRYWEETKLKDDGSFVK